MSVTIGPKGPRGPPGPTGAPGIPGEPSEFITLANDLAVVVSNNNGPAEIGKYINGFTSLSDAIVNPAVSRILVYRPDTAISNIINRSIIIEGMVDIDINLVTMLVNSGAQVILRNVTLTISPGNTADVDVSQSSSLTLERCVINGDGAAISFIADNSNLTIDSCVITASFINITSTNLANVIVKSSRLVRTQVSGEVLLTALYEVTSTGRLFSFNNYMECVQVPFSGVALFTFNSSTSRMVSIGDVIRIIPTTSNVSLLSLQGASLQPRASINQLTIIVTGSIPSINSGVPQNNTTSVVQNVTIRPEKIMPNMTTGQVLPNGVVVAPWKGSNITVKGVETYNVSPHDSTIIANGTEVIIPNNPELQIEGRELRVIYNVNSPPFTTDTIPFLTISGTTTSLPAMQGDRYYLKFHQGVWHVSSTT
uniref:Uncharacterized protein n=1 Tax=viral metagenome TaxID=1070528 RepID=A0A6C0BN04_9ZZZZ